MYVVPVLALVVYLGIQNVRDRRSGRNRDAEDNYGEGSFDEV